MNIIQGSGALLAGARSGEEVNVLLSNNKTEKIVLYQVNRYGIEGYQVNLTDRPLTFYPYTAILKVTKSTTIE